MRKVAINVVEAKKSDENLIVKYKNLLKNDKVLEIAFLNKHENIEKFRNLSRTEECLDNLGVKTVKINVELNKDSFFSPQLQNLLTKKDKLYSKLRKEGINPHQNKKYKDLSQECEDEVKKFKTAWLQGLNNCEYTSMRSFFGKAKILLEKNDHKNKFVMLDKKGEPILEENLPDAFGQHFVDKLERYKPKYLSTKFKKRQIKHPAEFFHSNPQIVEDIIKNTNCKLSAGFDEISNKLLKLDPKHISPIIDILAKEIFELSYWPSEFKTSKVIPLHKKGAKNDLNNYRFIALLSCMSKVIEKIIQKQITRYFEKNDLFHNLQAGYRKHFSCQSLTIDMVDKLLQNNDSKLMTALLFIDYTSAFDLLSADRLKTKLEGYGLLPEQIKLIDSYLKNRKFIFTAQGHKSKKFDIPLGCAQGSCLGPTLWLIFINDLPEAVKKQILSYLFADDCGELASNDDLNQLKNEMQSTAKAIHKWTIENGCIIERCHYLGCESLPSTPFHSPPLP